MNADSVTTPQANPCPIYEIRLKGHLGPEWSDWFDGLAVQSAEQGETLITGPVVDQAALHGLLKKVRNLGLPLLAVTCLQVGDLGVHDRPHDHIEGKAQDD